MSMKDRLPPGFASPTSLPTDQDASGWQQANRAWWELHPMRYDWKENLGVVEHSAAFYEEIDRRFFADAAQYTPPRQRPFDRLIPFDQLGGLDVLEIGVGSGSHAQLMAKASRTYTGIDLTGYAAATTHRRLTLAGLPGAILQMDAEQMGFVDRSFDFIWTWGVIHHSANTGRILQEMNRVLRPGGRATVMVYHRSALYTWVYTALIRGILLGGFRRHSLHDLLQLNTDGAIARFYRGDEWARLVATSGLVVDRQRIMGQKSEVVLLPAGRFKTPVTRLVPNWVARFITNSCGQGSFLITELRKLE